ncbi:MAG: aldehyde dehydrogenase family protein, partial [Thiobacillus sp.]
MSAVKLHLWINGQRVPSHGGRMGDVFNPATGNVIRRVPLASQSDIDAAVAAARAAFPAWRDT